MSELKEALQAILRVNFREHVPATDAARIADFLERSALELVQREEAVTLREQAVSERESAISLKEDELSSQVAALGSMRRLAHTLELKPVKGARAGMGRWLKSA